MHKINRAIQKLILKVIDFFYRPFSRIIPYQLFRYGASGASNMVFDWVLYFIFYNFISGHDVVQIAGVAMSGHIAAFVFTFPLTFISGFWLGRYISFKESQLLKRTQLPRYLFVVLCCIAINYISLKILVESYNLYPTPSKMITTVITVVFSYMMQKYFTFRTNND